MFLFLCNKSAPFQHHIRHIINTCNKGFNQCLLTAQFGACIHCLLDRNKDFLIVAVGIVILLDEHQNVVDIDLDLLDEFDFKDNIVRDVLFFAAGFAVLPFIPQVLIAAEVVLEVPLT